MSLHENSAKFYTMQCYQELDTIISPLLPGTVGSLSLVLIDLIHIITYVVCSTYIVDFHYSQIPNLQIHLLIKIFCNPSQLFVALPRSFVNMSRAVKKKNWLQEHTLSNKVTVCLNSAFIHRWPEHRDNRK